jgi:hypothetical protein
MLTQLENDLFAKPAGLDAPSVIIKRHVKIDSDSAYGSLINTSSYA